jgi:hypothetical protein
MAQTSKLRGIEHPDFPVGNLVEGYKVEELGDEDELRRSI